MPCPEAVGWEPGPSGKRTPRNACATKPGRLRAGEGGVLGLSDGGERGFDDVEAFSELLVGDNQRDENADDVVEGARGDGDEAVLVAKPRDLLGFGVGGLACASLLA